jgi:hypothetical protein
LAVLGTQISNRPPGEARAPIANRGNPPAPAWNRAAGALPR